MVGGWALNNCVGQWGAFESKRLKTTGIDSMGSNIIYLIVSIKDCLGSQDTIPSGEDGYREVSISKAVQLTQDDAVKSAILLELDISVSPYLFMFIQVGMHQY